MRAQLIEEGLDGIWSGSCGVVDKGREAPGGEGCPEDLTRREITAGRIEHESCAAAASVNHRDVRRPRAWSGGCIRCSCRGHPQGDNEAEDGCED